MENIVLERFWAKVDKSGECWIWTACKNSNGYGSFAIPKGNPKLAHRISWNIHFGEIPKGLFVCHHCDNPPCIRPSHLFVGTHSDNIKDAFKKGTISHKGEKHPQSKLTQNQVNEIRKNYSGKYRNGIDFAKKYGVHPTTISAIIRRINWK